MSKNILYAVTFRDKKEHYLYETIWYNNLFLTLYNNKDDKIEYVRHREISWEDYIKKGLNPITSELPIQQELF